MVVLLSQDSLIVIEAGDLLQKAKTKLRQNLILAVYKV